MYIEMTGDAQLDSSLFQEKYVDRDRIVCCEQLWRKFEGKIDKSSEATEVEWWDATYYVGQDHQHCLSSFR